MIHAHASLDTALPTSSNTTSDRDEEQRFTKLRHLMQKDDPTEAVRACDKFNRDFPDSAQGWNIASLLATRIGDPGGALRAADNALHLEPGRVEWIVQKANCLVTLGRSDEARTIATEMALRLYPSAQQSAAVGLLLARLNLHKEAETLFIEAVKQEPHVSGYHYNLATVQRFLGKLEESEESLDKAIALDPDDVEAWSLRSGLRRQTVQRNHIAGLRDTLERVSTNPSRQVSVGYALAKELEDLEEYGQSFACLKQAGDTRRKHMRYDIERDIQTLAKIPGAYRKQMFDGEIDGFVDAAPIFIIGMPRTGTTLIERILGSHSVVQAAGELSNFAVELVNVTRLLAGNERTTASELVSLSSKIDFSTLGQAYIESTRTAANGHAYFIDKLPLNFLYAGLIHLALPKAKIIHVERHPMDTCYAVYKTLFQSAYPFSYDLEELARYFVAYRQLMQHWNEVMPEVMHTVRYEDVVANTRAATESLLDYCDLSWEEQCLRFHESDEHSTTASASQVREPVYADSINRWRHYENELQPVTKILKNAGIAI